MSRLLTSDGLAQLGLLRAAVIVALATLLHPRNVERAQPLPVSGFPTKALTMGKVTKIIRAHFAAIQPG
ncbi:hypothetical protein [Hymenobacter sublimis]|uniref:Uncharacterized protein n=1 Tax=Hymenobacter sublimis TaxID=2933777 RepID=A0ABY4JBG5_9BACT|nr:hypothetical protein [Hymenobacter sublimis]UPL50166.1 hypothetical protein MWH26_04465 [Hymenobacter sublimis]